MAVLQDLTQMTQAQLIAQIEAMRAAAQTRLSFKVTEKGACSVYGLGRFPVTLYASQWDRLLASAKAITEFLNANRDKLTTKAP